MERGLFHVYTMGHVSEGIALLTGEASGMSPAELLQAQADELAGGAATVEDTVMQRQRFCKPGGPPYAIKDEFIKRITFREQDLLADRFDTNLDLIICRNVIIYFTNEAKNMLFKKFYDALRPGGVLFLGGTEIISRPGDFGYRNFGISFYKKD